MTTTPHDPHTPGSDVAVAVAGASLSDRMRYAAALADARLLPAAYRRSPADVLLAVEYAAALGIAPSTALSSIHVVDGKPSMSAELMRALVLRAGHRFRIVSTADDACTVEVARADDPEARSRFTFTVGDARRAGLLDRRGSSWATYPRAMCLARATSEACRAVFPDVLAGVSYTPDELGAVVDESGGVVVGTVVERADAVDPDSRPADRPDDAGPPAYAATRDAMGLPPRGDERPPSDRMMRATWARLRAFGPRDETHARWALGRALGLGYVDHVPALGRAAVSTFLDLDDDAVRAAVEATSDPAAYPHPDDVETVDPPDERPARDEVIDAELVVDEALDDPDVDPTLLVDDPDVDDDAPVWPPVADHLRTPGATS